MRVTELEYKALDAPPVSIGGSQKPIRQLNTHVCHEDQHTPDNAAGSPLNHGK